MFSFHKYISLTTLCLVIPALLLLVGTATAAAPTAAFSGTPTSGAAPLTVSFTDLSAGSPTGWAWFFGDEAYTGAWTVQNASSGWTGRNWHSSVALPGGSVLLMGGADLTGYQNDTWRSDDNGRTWTLVNASSGWAARADHASVALPDGSIIVMGGCDADYTPLNDTWRSTDNGMTWTQLPDAGWSARFGSTAVTLPDRSIILMGGEDSVGYRNDVWRSDDSGATWTLVSKSPGWSARAWHTSVVKPDGSILMMGGDDGSNRMNDVWRSDNSGATWTQLPGAGWAGRAYHTSVTMPDGSILVMGGMGATDHRNDVWRSDDNGITWMQLPDAGWSERQNPTAVALPDGSVIVMGGCISRFNWNDTWRFQPAGSTEENPTHTYTAPGTYSVALQVFNDNGYNATRMIDYITVTPSAPAAAFSGTPTSGTAPLTVTFTDRSAGSPTGWAWFFGDEAYTGAWTEQNASSGWSGRFGHTSVATLDGSILLMGGCDDTYTRSNDMWRSNDSGRTWTQLPGAGWTGRFGHSSVALPGGSVLLMGGADLTGYQNDTWRSDDNGRTWTLVNASSGWAARADHASVALPDGSIIVMGGCDADYMLLNDTWKSIDKGRTWTLVNESPGWAARIYHTSVAMSDGSILVLGGTDIMTAFNDTWHSDDGGMTWTRLPDAGWTERYLHAAVAMPDDSILVLGGIDGMAALNDTWRSDDNGRTWTRLPDAGWTGRHGVTAVAMPDGSIALMGGSDDDTLCNDTWRLQPAGSTEQNPTHIYTAPGTYPVTLQTSNATGCDSTRTTGYITVRPWNDGGGDSPAVIPVQLLTTNDVNVGGNSAVARVNVTGTGIGGLIVTGTVRSSPPAEVPPAPGSAYQYIDLVPARFGKITGATITFTVPVLWLEEHGFSPEEIVLYHYNGTAWEALPTVVESTAGATVTFTATSPGFSLFAITGIEQAGEVTTPTAAQTTARAVAEPTPEETTAAPAGEPVPEFPYGTVAVVVGVVLVLAAGGYLIRSWWRYRQNPALFRKYN